LVVEPSGDSAAASFPASGGTLTTASGDTFRTKLNIPSINNSTTASITESPIVDGYLPCNSFKTCYSSEFLVPGVITDGSHYLTFELWMDKSNIKKGAKIDSVLIYYTGDKIVDGALEPVENYLVQICSIPDTPREDGLPCINKQVFFKNKTVTGWTPALDGDFYWQLISRKNGFVDVF
jgi:hypothetical protein